MRDIAGVIARWLENRDSFALATVTSTWGSSPRPVGSVMAVRHDMSVVGSVSGGCIENAVIDEAVRIIDTGLPKLLRFGISDETALSAGLSCGGTIHVYVEPYFNFSPDSDEQEIGQRFLEGLQKNCPMVLITRLESKRPEHFLYFPVNGSFFGKFGGQTKEASSAALKALEEGFSGELKLADKPVFLQVIPRQPRLIIIGATHISIPLVKYAHELGFVTTVIDPRQVFANEERFSLPPDELITAWPDKALQKIELNEDTYTVLLTHDPKIDDTALKVFLNSPVAYIGALGSRRTQKKRLSRMQEDGYDDDDVLSRIHGPVGLDINAQSPAEIALSIAAEITKVRNQRRKSNAV